MTEKQLQKLKDYLREKYKDDLKGRFSCREEKEISCREMINSLLCYNYYNITDAKTILMKERGRYHDYLKKHVDELGEQRVIELIEEQRASIFAVLFNVGEDNEGVMYNSIVWADEQTRVHELCFANSQGKLTPSDVYFFERG